MMFLKHPSFLPVFSNILISERRFDAYSLIHIIELVTVKRYLAYISVKTNT